ncbi:MAG: hypothetical protein FJ265_15840 [Planctomycetes bacterium]|nr:hypothetical protein [Planctomycetota bacterium]
MMRGILRAALASAALGACGCSVADNLSYRELAAELDAIVQVDGTGVDRRIHFADRAPVSAWYLRWALTQLLRWPLGFLFGTTHEGELDDPVGHVRALVSELPDEAGADLDTCTDALLHLVPLAELDTPIGVRVAALEASCRVAGQLPLPLFVGAAERFGLPPDPARVAAARTALQLGRPEQRGAEPLGQAQADAYAAALREIVASPLPAPHDRLALVGELRELHRRERDAGLRSRAAVALRRSLQHVLEGVLVRMVQGRDPQLAELRLCAIQHVRAAGGPEAVPFLLAVMAAPAAEVSTARPRLDPDPLVRLRLVHLCGQLRGELALRAVRLPGRDPWDAMAPADFLAWTILTETGYYSKLRVAATAALALCLSRRDVPQDLDWVRQWRETRQRQS